MRKQWVPNSRSVISPKIWPRIHPFFPKYAPVSTPSSYCIGYRAILTTGPSYYPKCTLCNGKICMFSSSVLTKNDVWLIMVVVSYQLRKNSQTPSKTCFSAPDCFSESGPWREDKIAKEQNMLSHLKASPSKYILKWVNGSSPLDLPHFDSNLWTDDK